MQSDNGNNDFGETIRKRRIKLGLTQNDVADYVGLARGQLNYLERGSRYPSWYHALRLCAALGIPLRKFELRYLIPLDAK